MSTIYQLFCEEFLRDGFAVSLHATIFSDDCRNSVE